MRGYMLVATCAVLARPSQTSTAEPGARYPATEGEVWPRPRSEERLPIYYTVDPDEFLIVATGQRCKILKQAVRRYSRLVAEMSRLVDPSGLGYRRGRDHPRSAPATPATPAGGLARLRVALARPCEKYPYLGMDESYNLTLSSEATLASDSLWGALRGLETFSQLLYLPDDYSELRVPATNISDAPRFPHRGLLVDSARHYLAPATLLTLLDAMAYNKLNVLHWHLVDDESFPYQSRRYPELSERGAYSDLAVYTPRDVALIVEYARARGVRVVPEFDMPGHTRSWGESHKELLTECYKNNTSNGLGPMNPIKPHTYGFIRSLLEELRLVFPDHYIHLGGDEVDSSCWKSNPEIAEYLRDHSDVPGLGAMFMSKMLSQLPHGRDAIVWEEAFWSGAKLPNGTIVQKWKFWEETRNNHKVTPILRARHRVVYSSALYLDYVTTSAEDPGDWWKYYQVELADKLDGSPLDGVLGGEACMWAESVDDTNIVSRVWPRASAAAEKLWSAHAHTATVDFHSDREVARLSSRLQEHTCRMRRRGVPAQPPAGPAYCLTLADILRFRSHFRRDNSTVADIGNAH